jgi:hypothetical protein
MKAFTHVLLCSRKAYKPEKRLTLLLEPLKTGFLCFSALLATFKAYKREKCVTLLLKP